MSYTSLDEAVKILRSCVPGALMAKVDIESAFCLLPVHLEDFSLLGLAFEGYYYVDRAFRIGCSISCSIFEKFSSFLEWAAHFRSGMNLTAHYLDDFLFMGQASSRQCQYLLDTFTLICKELGVPLATAKSSWALS